MALFDQYYDAHDQGLSPAISALDMDEPVSPQILSTRVSSCETAVQARDLMMINITPECSVRDPFTLVVMEAGADDAVTGARSARLESPAVIHYAQEGTHKGRKGWDGMKVEKEGEGVVIMGLEGGGGERRKMYPSLYPFMTSHPTMRAFPLPSRSFRSRGTSIPSWEEGGGTGGRGGGGEMRRMHPSLHPLVGY